MEEDYSRKQKKQKVEKESSFRHVVRLLVLSASGEHKRLKKLLQRHPDLDINSYNSEGFTPLHQAARFGHADTVKILLKLGADGKAEDFRGNTAAHLAAAGSNVAVLTELLQAKEAPDLDASNTEGFTLRELMKAAIEERVARPPPADRATASMVQRSQLRRKSESEGESEDEWAAKLRMNAGFDDPYQDQSFAPGSSSWESWEYTSWDGPDLGGTPQSEEDYARRMWEDMQRRKSARQGPSAATAETWGAADSAQGRRRKAAEDAAENSRRILEEEREKDRAWRQAVLQGDMGARRAGYEAKWQVFATSQGPIRYDGMPWLVEEKDDARGIILYGTSGEAEKRKRLRLELMRWHPDKFEARFGGRVVAEDRERVLQRVKETSQMLNSLG